SVAESISQISGDRQIRRLDNRPTMGQVLIARQPMILAALGCSRGRARRGQCLEAKPRKNASRAHVPGVRNDQGARSLVKRAKAQCFFFLAQTHAAFLEKKSCLVLLTERCDPHSAARPGMRSMGQPPRGTDEP